MGLLLLLVNGAALGWLFAVSTRGSTGGEQPVPWIAVGAVSSILAGALVHNGSLLIGVSPDGFLASTGVAILTLGLYTFATRHLSRDGNR
ncbi:hypothetical protein [Qipengyuania sp. JC766]|uniref:hypothetical protein n=1 Tax=Qipengyuania sp. JC766 TaxID=3232139 RepID=UPI0034586D39